MSTKAASAPGRKKASNMFKEAESFSSFSVNDLKKAKEKINVGQVPLLEELSVKLG